MMEESAGRIANPAWCKHGPDRSLGPIGNQSVLPTEQSLM